MFEQTFKNIDDILHKEAGCTGELDYTEQSSWLLFLKYLYALERDKAAEAALEGKAYAPIHADKLAIPARIFRSHIELIRRKGLVPDGRAKYVGGQQPSL